MLQKKKMPSSLLPISRKPSWASGRWPWGSTDWGFAISCGMLENGRGVVSAQVMVQCLQGLEGRVVSVVGLAHVDGMQSRWDAWQKRSRQLS